MRCREDTYHLPPLLLFGSQFFGSERYNEAVLAPESFVFVRQLCAGQRSAGGTTAATENTLTGCRFRKRAPPTKVLLCEPSLQVGFYLEEPLVHRTR